MANTDDFLGSIQLGLEDQQHLIQNADNYMRVLTRAGPNAHYLDRVDAVINRLDKNHDGQVDYEELREIDAHGTLLRKCDTDGNGALSAFELRMFFDRKALDDITAFVKFVVYLERKLKINPPRPAPLSKAQRVHAPVPLPPFGSVYVFQTVQTGIGLAGALALEWVGAEERVAAALRLNGSGRSIGIAVAVVALVAQLVMIPGMKHLIDARATYKVGQPVHHPAPRELGSEEDRLLFLYKLRAYEGVVEWLPVFIAQAFAVALLGKVGTACLLCVPYALGKTMFAIMYGAGDANARIPGLVVADFFGLLVLRAVLLLELYRHFTSA